MNMTISGFQQHFVEAFDAEYERHSHKKRSCEIKRRSEKGTHRLVLIGGGGNEAQLCAYTTDFLRSLGNVELRTIARSQGRTEGGKYGEEGYAI